MPQTPFSDWALDWLDEPNPDDKPFLLYMAYNAPHWPLHAHAREVDKYNGVYEEGYEAIRKARYQRQLGMGLFNEKTAPLSPADHKAWDALGKEEHDKEALRMQIHAAMVDNVDQNVGRLVAKLKALGEFEDTLILFIVDNGSSHERPNRGGKTAGAKWGTVGSFEAIGSGWANATNSPFRKWKIHGMEGGVCTPMIAHWPNGIKLPKNSISREPCHLVDFLPTFMELAGCGAKYPDNLPPMDGVSFAPTFTGKPIPREEPIFHQFGSWQAIRDKEWKLVQRGKDPWQLYNLASDRTETNNVAKDYPGITRRLQTQWEDWSKGLGLSKKAPKKNNKKSPAKE